MQNSALLEQFGMTPDFLNTKIGISERAVAAPGENASDMCVQAWKALTAREGLAIDDVEAILVVTQTPDYPIPHCSALVHGAIGLNLSCAAFDISLGCSGYVYALSIMTSFMSANGMKNGVLFTCDPYSKIVDPADRNTALLFGDAATATWIGQDPVYRVGNCKFATDGKRAENLILRDRVLQMNGREIFSFAVEAVPSQIEALLKESGLTKQDIDHWVIHPGSKYILDTITRFLEIESAKVATGFQNCGNTVSSSVPLLLESLDPSRVRRVIVSGFGVGLSWASALLERK